jgi:hypothetical protein
MICTFCGNDNQPGTRFCGMCGVRLERRKAERRITEGRGTKCPSCEHLNEPGHKFCGMCGIRIDRRVQDRRVGEQKFRANAMANAQLPTPELRPTVVHRQALNVRVPAATVGATALAESADSQVEGRRVLTSLGGPSFLGLNEEETDSEYLLEEEGSSGGGIRTLVLLVILLAIGGLIYVQYRSNLNASPKSPDQPKPNPALVPQQHGKDRQQSAERALATIAGASNLQAAAANLVKKAASSASEDSSTAAEKVPKAAERLANAKIPAEPVDEDTGKGKGDRASPDPSVASKNEPSGSLIKAQKYLHGRGVRQSCEQGLIYLKAATRESDPQAAVQMAALYASGFCVRQDRVKAYQWFSTAQEMNPDNRWITKNMSQLWAHMTPQERQQIR